MAQFSDRLVEAIERKDTRVCVGIDPRPEWLPPPFARRARGDIGAICEALLEFHRTVFEIVEPHAACVKLNAAYFERLGPYGAPAMFATIHSARQFDLPVIADVKRGDIEESAEAYAQAWFEAYPADAVTIHPYLGADSARAFCAWARDEGRGVFVLVRTSNDSAAEIQNALVDGEPMFLRVARLAGDWGRGTEGKRGWRNVGAVASGRHPEDLARIRSILPDSFLLVPGFGAQGGNAASVRPAFARDGLGAIVNASRSVVYAWMSEPYRTQFGEIQWQKAIEAAILRMKDEVNRVARGG